MSAEPFSHAVLVRDIPAAGRHFRVEADEAERRNLAEDIGIAEIRELAAEIEICPAAGRAFSVRGQLRAVVVQDDVVTLDPFSQEVVEAIDLTLMPAEKSASKRAKEVLVDVAEEDGPDLFRNGRIDLGTIIGEHLALGLDPYPRAPGTEFAGHVEDDPASDPSPFAALAALNKRGE